MDGFYTVAEDLAHDPKEKDERATDITEEFSLQKEIVKLEQYN